MKRRSILSAALTGALCGLAVLLPATASAQAVELGETTTPLLAPSCVKGDTLANCKIVLTRTTAIEASSDGVINPTRVNREGWIVSFTVGLSNLVPKATERAAIIKNLDSEYGGAPELALSVLKPGPDNTYTVVAQSGTYPLLPYLGQLLEQPLALPPQFTTFTALPVLRGEVVGLTIPTWAPVLSYDLPTSQFSYRQSRKANCNNPAAAQTAQTKTGQTGTYGCFYTGTRMQYSATEITDTKEPPGSSASALRPR